jgi:hypothetical protein
MVGIGDLVAKSLTFLRTQSPVWKELTLSIESESFWDCVT